MLEELHVRDLALIEDVWLQFAPGMTVLTGETGAGKTALVGALKLLVGERADSTLLRAGAAEAVVEGRFDVDGGEILAQRRVGADGRSRCSINDEMSTVTGLSSRLGPLVDLHGQHDHQALLAPSSHVDYFDRYAGQAVIAARGAYSEARDRFTTAVRKRDEMVAALADWERQADYLRFVTSEIDAAAVHGGEDDELEARLPALRHGERLAEAVAKALSAIRAEGGVADGVATAVSFLSKVQGLDPRLNEMTGRLTELASEFDDAGASLRSYGESLVHDPGALDEVESRLSALTSLKKKYGPSLQEVLKSRDEALERLAVLGAGQDGVEAAQTEADRAEADLRRAAADLDERRREAAPHFVADLASASADLAMETARFEVAFSEQPFESWSASGPHKVEFLFSATGSEPPRPIARIASGGEISRVMLALKSVLGTNDDVPILVFDEIDSGIGGATAHAVGRRLSTLAAQHQVIVVTHLAQVAVFADRQLVVSRGVEDERTLTSVTPVEGDERVAEIARMLSGTDSDASLAHASQLLERAQVARDPHRARIKGGRS